ncbi:MAG: aldo/keto reductase [Bowdeniella nasicola]|nr:aldo/keto reductase [Bowdeniella nasicola]
MPTVPTRILNDGTVMPRLGLGVWQVPDEDAETIVEHALTEGYRLIDTAKVYGNEAGVGRGIAASGVAREDIFLTTKLWNKDQGRDATLRAFDASLERLGTDYVDLYLIHWPCPKDDLYVETWKTLVEIRESGRAKAIGVSNFLADHVKRIIDESGVVPAVNQIEMHPRHSRPELRELHEHFGIATEAYSPLGSGKGLLEDPVVQAVASEAGVSPAQAVLAWHLAQDVITIPKTATPERLVENLAAVDVRLTDAQRAAIDALNSASRVGSDPAEVDIDLWD